MKNECLQHKITVQLYLQFDNNGYRKRCCYVFKNDAKVNMYNLNENFIDLFINYLY